MGSNSMNEYKEQLRNIAAEMFELDQRKEQLLKQYYELKGVVATIDFYESQKEENK